MEDSFEAIRRLMIAINKIDGCYYFCARKLGVKENMLALLYALDDGKPHSQKQIYEDWLIPKTTISTIVKELVKEGYIILLAEEESREKTILLTESGKEYTRILLEKFYTTEQEALKFATVFASMAISRYNSKLPSQEEVLISMSKTKKSTG